MEPLPTPAYCSLDGPGLSAQLERYRVAGAGAEVIRRDRRRLVVRVGDDALDADVEQLVAVERACCPFFELSWRHRDRCLEISVSTADAEPALEAIADALALPRP